MYGHVLRPEDFLQHARYEHAAPESGLSRWVERYWSVTWDLGPGQVHRATTLDEPSVHLTHEAGGIRRAGTDGAGTWITGPVTRGCFAVDQLERGGVVGIKFRLGGTTAFVDADLASVCDRTLRAGEWFEELPPEDLPLSARRAAPLLDAWLMRCDPRERPGFAAFQDVLALLEEPEITSIATLEQRSGLGTRSLQRQFRRFVGVGPKRMLLRSRVMRAVAAIDRGVPRSIADLANDLGWFDQSHLLRDIRSITGRTPSSWSTSEAGILEP